MKILKLASVVKADSVRFQKELLAKTEKAYGDSDIKCKGFSYAIAGNPIKKRKPIIIGLNWGGGSTRPQDVDRLSQESPEEYAFIKKLDTLMKGIPLTEAIPHLNYTNISFFRSSRINELSPKDWDLSFPLLEKYIQFIQPPWILVTTIGRENLSKIFRVMSPIEVNSEVVQQGNRKYKSPIVRMAPNEYSSFLIGFVPYPGQAGGINGENKEALYSWVMAELKILEWWNQEKNT